VKHKAGRNCPALGRSGEQRMDFVLDGNLLAICRCLTGPLWPATATWGGLCETGGSLE
jgi:hypothetical protein